MNTGACAAPVAKAACSPKPSALLVPKDFGGLDTALARPPMSYVTLNKLLQLRKSFRLQDKTPRDGRSPASCLTCSLATAMQVAHRDQCRPGGHRGPSSQLCLYLSSCGQGPTLCTPEAPKSLRAQHSGAGCRHVDGPRTPSCLVSVLNQKLKSSPARILIRPSSRGLHISRDRDRALPQAAHPIRSAHTSALPGANHCLS